MKKQIRLSAIGIAASAFALTIAACSTPETKSWNQGINVIPVPVELTQNEGTFTLKNSTVIACEMADFAPATAYLAAKVKGSTGYDLKIELAAPASNYIRFVQDTVKVKDDEGYTLTSTDEGVVIAAAAPAGAFYGMQTLLQLLPAEIESPDKIAGVAWNIPAVSIKDQPRFKYRGSHMDVTRHFASVELIKKQLDVLAMYKINRLHWHLTDDQLWTIEIKKYPELKSGSTRIEGDGSTYGGFYTQEEIKDVVAYATARYIDVIPEIEMPGHAKAALVSHPELSCTGGPFDQPRIIWGVEDDVFCPGKEVTFEFLENVISEVAELFPSKYIHVGGDECPKVRWKSCPDCQKRIKDLGLKELGLKGDGLGRKHSPEEMLQSYTITRIEKFANSKGKMIIGWDEILEGGLAPSATVMSWRGIQGGIDAATLNHNVIMTPQTEGYYIDHFQGAAEVEPVSIGGNSTLKKVYSYNPIPDTLPADKHQYIWGAQGNLWSEYVLSPEHREYMMYPRLIAIAEVTWSPNDRKDWELFSKRIFNAQVRLDYHDVNYHIPMPEGTLVDILAFTGDSVAVPFNNTRDYPMVYTLDGTQPTENSTLYADTLMIGGDVPVVIHIATVLPQGKMSKVRTIRVEKQALKPATVIAEGTAVDSGVVVRMAPGLYVTPQQLAGAKFGADSVVRYFRRAGGPESKVADSFLEEYEGFVELPEDGVYGFTTDMDELWIDGERVIFNDQASASRHLRHKTTRALAAGKHPFKLVFNNMIKHGWPNSWSDIAFYIQAPGAEKYQRVRMSQLTHVATK